MMMIVHIYKERADLNRNRVTTTRGNSDKFIVDTVMNNSDSVGLI